MPASAIHAALPADPPNTADFAGLHLGHVDFHEVLSALNPLQYLPVVGPIYRAITGDAAPESLRIAVSGISGLLIGGPIGLVTSILGTVATEFVEDHVHIHIPGPDQLAAARAYQRASRAA